MVLRDLSLEHFLEFWGGCDEQNFTNFNSESLSASLLSCSRSFSFFGFLPPAKRLWSNTFFCNDTVLRDGVASCCPKDCKEKMTKLGSW